MELTGASAVVTGGASGLGAAAARALAGAGMKIAVLDLADGKGSALAEELGGEFVHCDVTAEGDVAAGVEAAVRMGELRAVVNCAGIGFVRRTLDREGTPHDLASFRRVIEINLIGTFNTVRIAAAAMAQNQPGPGNDRGAVVNIASVAAFDGQIGQPAYSASKAGVAGMTLPLARDLSVIGVRVNTIAPGVMDTPMLAELPEAAKESLAGQVLHPRRLGRPEEFAELVMFLMTHPYMNGETVRMDGGIRMGAR